jgi:hypothetical protein
VGDQSLKQGSYTKTIPRFRGVSFSDLLSQDNVQTMEHPGNAPEESQDKIDPKIIIDRALFQVHSERRNKQT